MTDPGFTGFHPPVSNTTYTPNQFFDVVLRHASRGTIRMVAYLIRKTLGWCDADGKPREPQVTVSWHELEERGGIGHSSIAEAVEEAVKWRYITCVRPGRPDTAGNPARSACYRLRWDESGRYPTEPTAFQGFYAGNGNLTYIPNQFFDEVVPQEPQGVLRVVGAVIRHTIGFQTHYGFRRQQVRLSVSDLVRITRLNRDTVRLGLAEALAKGYLLRVEAGCFDRAGGKESRAAVYGLHWRDGFGAAEPLRKPVRHRSEKPHGERSEIPHGIEITENNKIKKRRQAAALPDEAQPVVEQLQAVGFDRASVEELVRGFPLERLQRQLAWLPKRNPRRNARGLLKRAVEEDWPEPRVELPQTPAVRFAAGFYAGWSGTKGQAMAQPTANDLAAAEPYLKRLEPVGGEPEGWGREFGAHARRSEFRRDAPCSLVYALRVHGDGFHELLVERQRKAQRLAEVKTRCEHQARHEPAYFDYLRACGKRLQAEAPEAFARFLAHEEHQRRFMQRSELSARALELLDREEERLRRLYLFFTKEPGGLVLDFWGWDEKANPSPSAPTWHHKDGVGTRFGTDRS